RAEAGAERKTAADPFGNRHDVGRHAHMLIGEQRPGAGDAGLHLVENQHEAMLVAESAQSRKKTRRRNADAALTLDRLDQNAGRLRSDGALVRLDVAKRDLIEAVARRTKPFE